MIQISRQNLPLLLARVIPYLAILAVVIAVILYATLVGISAAVNGALTVGVPVILASAIAIWKPGILKRSSSIISSSLRLNSRSFLYIVLLFTVLYLVSLCFLVQGGARPIAYFCLIAVMAGLIFIEILGTGPVSIGRRVTILAQIALLAMNLIFGQTLKLPLYFGFTDVLYHIGYVSSIVDSGYVTSAMGQYENFPLFHIFGASGVLVTGMPLQISYYVFNGLSFVVSIPIIYLLVKQVTSDTRLPLLAALLYCLSREVIFNGMYMNTREMAYLFCLLVLFLLIQRNWRLRIIAVGLIVPLVLLHHTTLVHFSGILVLIMVIEYILYRRSRHIGYNYLLLFVLAYVGYWFWLCYPYFESMVSMVIYSEVSAPLAETRIIPGPFLGPTARSADYFLVVFFALIGIVSLLYRDDRAATVGRVFALVSVVLLPFFIPAVANLFSHIFLTSRLPLLISPVIAMAMAAGVLAFVPRPDINRHRLKTMALLGLILLPVLLFSLISVVLLGGRTDLNLRQIGGMVPRQYFTQAELSSFSFLVEHKGDIPIYSDYHSTRYLEGYSQTPANGTIDVLHAEAIEEGYMLYREEQFDLRGVFAFRLVERTSIFGGGYTYRVGDTPDLKAMWVEESRVFNNNAVQIYLK